MLDAVGSSSEMTRSLPILIGIFVVMALECCRPCSPTLLKAQRCRAVYMHTFGVLSRFCRVMASDRIGRVPLIHAGLLLTLAGSHPALSIWPATPRLPRYRGVRGRTRLLCGTCVGKLAPSAWISGYVMAAQNLGGAGLWPPGGSLWRPEPSCWDRSRLSPSCTRYGVTIGRASMRGSWRPIS